MTLGEQLYLALVLFTFIGFSGVLAWISHISPARDDASTPHRASGGAE